MQHQVHFRCSNNLTVKEPNHTNVKIETILRIDLDDLFVHDRPLLDEDTSVEAAFSASCHIRQLNLHNEDITHPSTWVSCEIIVPADGSIIFRYYSVKFHAYLVVIWQLYM